MPKILTRNLTNSEKNQAGQRIAEWVESEFECDTEQAYQVAKSAIEKVDYKPMALDTSLTAIQQLTLACQQYIDRHPEEF